MDSIPCLAEDQQAQLCSRVQPSPRSEPGHSADDRQAVIGPFLLYRQL